MVKELSAYKALAQTRNWEALHVSEKKQEKENLLQNITDFWAVSRGVPAWRKFAHLCYLLQPSSACVERAFSFLKYIYDKLTKTSKQDLVEITLKLRYNSAKRMKTEGKSKVRRVAEREVIVVDGDSDNDSKDSDEDK